ncbi:MAG: flagellar basal body rod protein FlgC [Phycisphaerales bacterium]|nr:flagellar basal body rod protein FlgC [Phycisphaerales bacterium]
MNSLDVSVSGMIAQRTRMEVAIANLANQSTIQDEHGNNVPYKRRFALLASGDPSGTTNESRMHGVHVAAIETEDAPPIMRYEPGSPFANEEGYVAYPNIDPMTETINAMDAQRAYEANLAAAEATKAMVAQSLRILA